MSDAAHIAESLATIMARAQAEDPPEVEEPTPGVAYFVISTPVGRFRIDVAAL